MFLLNVAMTIRSEGLSMAHSAGYRKHGAWELRVSRGLASISAFSAGQKLVAVMACAAWSSSSTNSSLAYLCPAWRKSINWNATAIVSLESSGDARVPDTS